MTDETNNHEPVIRDKRRIHPETGEVRRPEEFEGEGTASSQDAGVLEDESSSQGVDTSEGGTASEGNSEPGGKDAAAEAVSSDWIDEGYEGPDIETSLSEADLNFLSGQGGPSQSEQPQSEQPAIDHLIDLQRITAEYANYRKRTEASRETERERAYGEAAKTLLPVLDDLHRAEKHGDLNEGGSFTAIAAKLRASAEKLGLKPFIPLGEPFDPAVHEAIFQQPSDVEKPTVTDVVEPGYYLGSTLLRPAKVAVAVPNG